MHLTADGERAFKVNGKALRIRKTLLIEDPSGRELMKIQERKLSIRDTMTIEDASEVLGITVGTARTHYARGKDRLRALLQGRNQA